MENVHARVLVVCLPVRSHPIAVHCPTFTHRQAAGDANSRSKGSKISASGATYLAKGSGCSAKLTKDNTHERLARDGQKVGAAFTERCKITFRSAVPIWDSYKSPTQVV